MKSCKLYRMADGSPNGGVVNGIEIDGYKGRYSAYYNAHGQMIDAENVMHRSGKSIKDGSKLWNAINVHSRLIFSKCHANNVDA